MVQKTASPASTSSKGKQKVQQKASPKQKPYTESLMPPEERVLIGTESAEYTESLISQEERMSMIAEAAYYRAEQRGFAPGDHEQDWLEAEKGVDNMLSEAAKKAHY